MGGIMKLGSINLFGRNRAENFSDTEFRRILEIREVIKDEESDSEREITRRVAKPLTSKTGARKNVINLAPMRSLSLEEFAFPFASPAKIASSLKLQIMPFSAAGELEIFPVILSRAGRGAQGLVWYVSPEELDFAHQGKTWPAPLPLVSQLSDYNGSGVTMWIDEENISSLLWQENKPVLYRWRHYNGEGSEQKELDWYDSYCASRELDRGGNFVVNASGEIEDGDENEEFTDMIAESVKICPWINDVNLSRSALEGARDLERSVRLLSRVAIWLLVLGGIALSAGVLRWQHTEHQIQEVRTRSANYYRQVFDPQRTGNISNPVTLARDRIAELTGTGKVSHPLEEVLADLGEISAQNKDVTLDVIRWNSEGIDCTGNAPDMSKVLNFRKAWEDKNNMAQVDNTQLVSGIGYRFDLRVRWQ